MEKTKLGISVSIMGALAFLCGYSGFTVMALVCGYILIREDNQELRRNAVYAIALSIAFFLLSFVFTTLQSFLTTINLGNWQYDNDAISGIKSALSFCVNLINFVERIVFGVLALFCLLGKSVRIAFLDKFVEK